jgi:ATP-dependent exoDNAse (exonuclease V) alpha subunit
VLCAVNDRSPMSRKKLNKALQAHLNPGQGETGGLRLRDKVVCLKNGFYLAADGYDQSDDAATNADGAIFVANGELAEVIEVEPARWVFAKLESPARVVKVPLFKAKDDEDANQERGDSEGKGSVGNWDLAYALSVHKAQGSEFKVVCVVLDSYAGAKMVCDRAWIYTSISRARMHCVLVGTKGLAERFCKVAKIDNRKTFLREMIAVESFKRESNGL